MFDKTAAEWTAWLDGFIDQADEALAVVAAAEAEDDNVPMAFA